MPGFHSVTHVPSLQQAQTIVREQSLFSDSKAPDVEALKVAEFVDNYCDSHITTRFPEDLSRLLIAAFKAGQNNVMAYVPESPSKADRDLQSDIRYLIDKTEDIERFEFKVDITKYYYPLVALLLAALSGILYIAVAVSR